MDKLKIERRLNTRIEKVALPEIVVSHDGTQETLNGFDAVVVAAGRIPENSLAEAAKSNFPNMKIFTIGDASNPGLAIDAISNAAEIAAAI
jgi:pyruvate/2-oxoglutarate dehydrogenase complex dihydrolipoamide dehydrogenase (E3) component